MAELGAKPHHAENNARVEALTRMSTEKRM